MDDIEIEMVDYDRRRVEARVLLDLQVHPLLIQVQMVHQVALPQEDFHNLWKNLDHRRSFGH